jgi:hypothetical protein
MLVLRRGTEGGHLHLPEYDVTLAVPNNSVTIFNGQQEWHGVTPMQVQGNGYRFSLVWYAKTGFTAIGSQADEARRAALDATEKASAKHG